VYAQSVTKVKLLVLISTHNRQKELTSCLTSLQKSFSFTEFLVSLSNSGDAIRIPSDLSSKVIASNVPINSFWADAMSRASELYRDQNFTHVLWLNEDVVLFPNSIDNLMNVMNSCAADIAVGQTCSEDGKISYGGFLRESVLKPLHFHRVIAHNEPIIADTFNGNIVLVGPGALVRLGPFMHGYSHYLADLAYGLEALRKGLKIVVAPGFSGTCESNNAVNPSFDKSVPRKNRIRVLNKPQGFPIRQQVRFSIRYGGISGIMYIAFTYLRFLITLIFYRK
jgi:GT2 family glycosyltransferase